MNAGQYEDLMARLGQILDRMPERPAPEPERVAAVPMERTSALMTLPPSTYTDARRRGASAALSSMLSMLDGWIEGFRENHDGLGHRGENRGEECWTQFHPADIRNMVNDVARELGLTEFPKPEMPKEDEVR